MSVDRFLIFARRLGLGLLVSALAGCPGGPVLSPNVTLTADLVYGYGYVTPEGGGDPVSQALRFNLIAPNDDPVPNKPAVLLIHGGSFDHGTKDDEDLVAYADALATVGYVCFLIDYRLQGDKPPAPEGYNLLELEAAIHAAFVDAKTAMRHIRANSEAYGIDPSRVAAMGDSAGAFAALAAGITGPEVFADDGPGFPVPPENNPDVNSTPTVVIDFWGSADAVLNEFDENDPPIMIVHGTNDFGLGTFYTSALSIVNACEENGIPHRFYPLVGKGHGAWDAIVDGNDLAALTLEFLAEYMP